MANGARPLDRYGIVPPPAYDMTSWHLPHPLRDFQEEAVKALGVEGRGTFHLPTGSGKTLIAAALVIELKVPMVVLVPTKALIDQKWLPELAECGIHAGVYFGEEKRPGFVTISTYQSLFRNPDVIRSFPLIVFDEGDLTTGEFWKAVLEEAKQHPYAAVLTATLPVERERRSELLASFPVLVKRSPREMIEQGFFVPVAVVPWPISLGPEANRQYQDTDRKIRQLRRMLGTGNPTRIRRMMASNVPTKAHAAGAYLRLIQLRSSILALIPERTSALLAIAQAHPGERILAFGTRVEPLAEACAYLTASGIHCRIISGATSRDDRRFIFQHWGLDVQVVASVDVLTRGIDVPEVGIAVLLGGGAGHRRLIQRVGRVVRPSPGKDVATCYVVYAQGTTEDRLVTEAQRIFQGGKLIEDVSEDEDGDSD